MPEVVIHTSGGRRRGARLIPVVGVVREQSVPAVPTPHLATPWPRARPETLLMAQLTDSQQATLSLAYTDRKGQPAAPSGTVQWLVDNPNLLALTPSADGSTCVVAAVGPLGTATVSVKASVAEPGGGTTDLAGSIEVSVVSGAATTVTVNMGPPSEQP